MPEHLPFNTEPATAQLSVIHRRFARAAFTIYLATVVAGVAALLLLLTSNRQHEEEGIRERLLLEADLRAYYLSRSLLHVVKELGELRKSLSVDGPIGPTQLTPPPPSSTERVFFNSGRAIIGADGKLQWKEPQYMVLPSDFSQEPWFAGVKERTSWFLVARPRLSPDPHAVLWLVSPVRGPQGFLGAVLASIDFHGEHSSTQEVGNLPSSMVLTYQDGVVFPPSPPDFAEGPTWTALVAQLGREKRTIHQLSLNGLDRIVAASEVPGTSLLLLEVADDDALFAAPRRRLRLRTAITLGLALVAVLILLALLRRSFQLFQQSEKAALREERTRLLGNASNLIAHEIKNSLNNFRLGIDLLAQENVASTAERRARIVGTTRKEIQRLSDFTSSLLMFAKGISIRLEPVRLAPLLNRLQASFEEAYQDQGVELQIQPVDPELVIMADASLLYVVLANLVGNALEACSLPGATQPARVSLSVVHTLTLVELRVHDSGPGVSDRILPRLFEAFASGKTNGVGLGLAMARRIARAHTGELVLESNRPGATFLLTLPAEKK